MLVAAWGMVVLATATVVAAENHFFEDGENSLLAIEDPTHRQVDFDDEQGYNLQYQDDVGFYKDNKPVRRPKRQRNRKPKRRPGRPPQGGRPQKQLGQWRPQRESIEDSPIALGAIRGGNGIRGIGRLREGGVTGFMKSFRRLIQRMI
ncbi:uncharacterized protein [Cherax quadricarinatus]|uniref:uncharacterized protein n=1 Tax=Cherax quadricarinatus TaxID=27406 RepID=UPI00387E2AAD